MSDFYIILINEDHSFIHTNIKRILRRSKNIDKLQFLVKPTYNDLDMTKVNAILEYVKPISGEYATITLAPEPELYKNRVQYLVPIDTRFTSEIGKLSLTINFSYLTLDEVSGEFKEQVRPIGSTTILIEDTPHWSDYIPSADLDNIAQIAMMNQATVEQNRVNIEIMNNMLLSDTASSLAVTDGKIHLINAKGEQKGESVDVVIPRIPDVNDGVDDGMIEVDDSAPDTEHKNDCDCGCDHNNGFIEVDDSTYGDSTELPDDENGFIEV